MIHVIGLGLGPAQCPAHLLDLLQTARLVAGGRRLLDELGVADDRRLVLGPLDAFARRIREEAQGGNVCVLADGDPLLYGLGASLTRFFAPAELIFHPGLSALQTACARFGLPWHDCRVLSLHGRSDFGPLLAALTHGRLAAVYTDQDHGPDAIARQLLRRGVTGWRIHVAEALCGPDERLRTVTLAEAAAQSWHPLNIVLLEQTQAPPLPLVLGLDEASLASDEGLMTKQPVRALALSLLRLDPDSVLWDLGAGSGAVSLEAARLLTRGRIVAVERDGQRAAQITENAARTGAWLVEVVTDTLEEFLGKNTHGSSAPSHIFLGGGATAPVLGSCASLLAPDGRMVVAAVLLSTLETARTAIQDLGWPLVVHQLMHHVSSPLAGDLRLVPSNPVFLLVTQKPHPSHE